MGPLFGRCPAVIAKCTFWAAACLEPRTVARLGWNSEGPQCQCPTSVMTDPENQLWKEMLNNHMCSCAQSFGHVGNLIYYFTTLLMSGSDVSPRSSSSASVVSRHTLAAVKILMAECSCQCGALLAGTASERPWRPKTGPFCGPTAPCLWTALRTWSATRYHTDRHMTAVTLKD